MTKKKTSTQIRSEAMKKSWAERRNSPMREQARKRTAAKPKEPQGEPKFWILWMPSSHKPPRIRFGTLEKVREVANIMVNKYRNSIYVMKSVELHKLGKTEVVPYNGAPVKTPVAVQTFSKMPTAPAPSWQFYDRNPPALCMQGRSWDTPQDDRLTELWYTGIKDYRILAERMGRSELAIEYRLQALGLISAEG